MGKPYSLDLRERIVSYVLAGNSARAAARVHNRIGWYLLMRRQSRQT
jgi:transposase